MNNIKKVIWKSGYRKNFIAEKIGVPSSHISMWISEDRKVSPDRVRKLCKILGCKAADLYPEVKNG